jgi:RND family efflux transporter MFP subunit
MGRVSILALVLLAGCDRFASDPPRDPPPRVVSVERAIAEDAVDRVELLGDVHGEQEVRVFAQVPERIRVLHVQEGDTVSAGDPIATLDADLQASGVVQADAALTAAEAARDQMRADRDRLARLVEQGAMPRTQLEVLESQLASAEAQVNQVRAARRTAGAQRDRTVVRAPIDGTVALLVVQQGDMAPPAMPLCSIVRTERAIVRVRLTEQDYVRVRQGMSVDVHPPALPDVARRGSVRRISPVLDPLTRTATVEIEVENTDGVLRPGMVAEISIELSRRADVILAPARAILLSAHTDVDNEASLFVLERGSSTVRRRTVRIGRRYGQRVEITRGLRAGEEVVVSGQHFLRDRARVRAPRAQDPPVAEAR